MSDPNGALGKWLLRDVLNVPERQVITYRMLAQFNIDSVMFTKIADDTFLIDFCEPGTYENFYEIEE